MKPRSIYRPDMRISSLTQQYTSSVSHDHVIAREVAETALIHVLALGAQGLLEKSVACRLAAVLRELVDNPSILIDRMEGFEDIHEALEAVLEEKAGRVAARSFPLARSRNDHVSMALRLWTARMLTRLLCETVLLLDTMLAKSREWASVPFPLHTHFQPAQVGTAGHWLHSYAEAFMDALRLVAVSAQLALRSPLGSGPAGGTTLPLNRRAYPLPPVLNTLYATGSRLFANAAVSAATVLMIEASRLAADIVLLSHPSIRALRLPDEHVSTSSAMPHKRNPVTAEVLRARAARVAGLAAAALGINHGLPHGYNLDLQEENPVLYQALSDALESIRVLHDMVKRLEVDGDAVKRLVESGAVLDSLERAEALALERRMPFRDAYLEVAARVRRGLLDKPLDEASIVKARVSLGAAGEGLLEAIDESYKLLRGIRGECTRLNSLLEGVEKWIEEVYRGLCG